MEVPAVNMTNTVDKKSGCFRFRRCFFMLAALIGLLSMASANVFAAQATLAWDPPVSYADGTSIASPIGYKVHKGTASGSYTQTVDVGNATTFTDNNLADGSSYYFVVSAYDAAGTESNVSNELSKTTTAPPPPPTTIYSITASAGSGGSISPASAIVSAGASQSFTIAPAAGYRVSSVTVDGVSVGAVTSYTFSSVSASHTIAASFVQNSYSITATAGTGGSISPAGSLLLSGGSSKTFSIVPASGYRILAVKVDGVSVGTVSSYTFSSINSNHSIQATFAAAAGQLITAIDCGGSIFTGANGISYKADTMFSGGSPNKVAETISGTTDQGLYQSWRYGTNFAYSIPVTNGNYSVTLKFAENFASRVGQRVFNVQAQGVTVLSNLDIYAKAGLYKAYDAIIPVTVSNGMLNIRLVGVVGNAIINGIVVKSN